MNETQRFAQNLAEETGELLSGYFKLSGAEPQVKADQSVVTEADMAADAFILPSLIALDNFLLTVFVSFFIDIRTKGGSNG